LYGLKIIVQLKSSKAKKRNIKLEYDFQQQVFIYFRDVTLTFKRQMGVTHSKQRRAKIKREKQN